MNTHKFINTGVGRILVGVVVSVVLVSAFWVSSQSTAKASALLDEKTLESNALAAAKHYGMQGTPSAKKAVIMTLAQWLALNEAELGKDAAQFGLTPDLPVYVLAIRGSVEWRGLGMPQPGQTAPEHYENITIVINARNGDLIWTGANRAGFAMPVPVSVP
jgi:hypothetical protein